MSSAAATANRAKTALFGLVVLLPGCVVGTPPTTSGVPDTTTTILAGTSSTSEPVVTTSMSTITTTTPVFVAEVSGVDAGTLSHSWEAGCPVGPDDLRLIEMRYWGFDDAAHEGSLVVHESHVEDLIAVFGALFDARYPIASMTPIGELPENAEDEPGYVNTSAFHCRPVKGSTGWSQHSFGGAVDLNPHLNPYLRGDELWPEGSERYLDRTLGEPGMIVEGDVVTTAFDEIDWGWGGRWGTLKDYHHFSANGR